MLLKVVLYGDRLWIVNMAANGGVGVQNQVREPHGISLWKFIRAG